MNGSNSVVVLLLAIVILTGTCFGGMLFANSDSPFMMAVTEKLVSAPVDAVVSTPEVRVITLTPDPSQKATARAISGITATALAAAPTLAAQATQTATAAQATQTAQASEEAQFATMVARTAVVSTLQAGAAQVRATDTNTSAIATLAADIHHNEQGTQVIANAVVFTAGGAALIAFLLVSLLVLVRANEGGIRRSVAAAALAEKESQLAAARAQAEETARLRLEADARLKEAQIRHEAVEIHRQEILKQRLQAEAYLQEVQIERLQAEARLIELRAEAAKGKHLPQVLKEASIISGDGDHIVKEKYKDNHMFREPDQGKGLGKPNLPLAG